MLSSEPGYYEDGKFGIRLENVLIIKESATQFNFANKGYLEFEHITWVSLRNFSYNFLFYSHIFLYYKEKSHICILNNSIQHTKLALYNNRPSPLPL